MEKRPEMKRQFIRRIYTDNNSCPDTNNSISTNIANSWTHNNIIITSIVRGSHRTATRMETKKQRTNP